MTENRAFRRWLLALALCATAVAICVYYVDRQVADFFHAHVRRTELWVWLNHLIAPFVLVPVAALFFLFGSGGWLLSGRQLGTSCVTPLLCSWSAVWALAAEFVFKEIFGRAWPDPTYIENHTYGFRLLHGGPHWDSFPSGTATIAAAVVATVWLAAPRLRLPSLVLAMFLCSGVVVTNSHWLSDVIAGAFLGATIGWMTVRLCPQAQPQLPSDSRLRYPKNSKR